MSVLDWDNEWGESGDVAKVEEMQTCIKMELDQMETEGFGQVEVVNDEENHTKNRPLCCVDACVTVILQVSV